MFEDQSHHFDRDRIAELLVAHISIGMELKAFGKAHDASTFLGMKSARMTVNEIHSGFGSDATAKGRQRDGMTLDAIDSLTLTSLSDSADPKRSQVAFYRKACRNKRVGSTNEKFLQTGIA